MAFFEVGPNGATILVRADGKTVDLSEFDEVGPICWGYFWVRKGELYGYMDELGNTLVGPRFAIAKNFTIDLFTRRIHAVVGHYTSKEGNRDPRYGYLSTNGYVIGSTIFKKVWPYNNSYAQVMLASGELSYIDDNVGIVQSTPQIRRMYEKKYTPPKIT